MTLMFLIGCFGLLGMTVLFPVMGFATSALMPRKTEARIHPAPRPESLWVFIPAHQEEQQLSTTLESVKGALSTFQKLNPSFATQVHIGVDASTDQTAQIARASGCQVSEFAFQSKWRSLLALMNAHTDQIGDRTWIALVDCGSRWTDTLLERVVTAATNENCVAIAPAYYPSHAGLVKNLVWSLERFLKKMENKSGGPVSVHGATVFYRGDVLLRAIAFLSRLSDRDWINDDVVIPLIVRAQNPGQSIYYPHWGRHGGVEDLAANQGRDHQRRQRMTLGNLQWIARVFPEVLVHAPLIALLALRRVFRTFWAYWALAFIAGGLVVLKQMPSLTALAATSALAGALAVTPSLGGAFRASLASPFLLRRLSSAGRVGAVWN